MTTQPTPAAALFRAILDLRIEFDILTEKVAKAAGLNPRDLGILDVLHSQGPSTPKELAERTGIHPATLTAILIRLERAGSAARSTNPADSRSTRVAITPATVQELDSYFAAIDQAIQVRMDTLTETTQLTIAEFLEDIGQIAREYRHDTTPTR
jgi:DNA-binding MarR family transcriptional regulator